MKKKIKLPKNFGKMKGEMIFKLETNNWNTLSTRDQDKALLFMYTVLGDLSKNRKDGYSPEFWAQYP